jgi:hypothetical protein
MGFFSGAFDKVAAFGKKAVESAKSFIGKTRDVVQKGVQMYDQGKQLYDQGKSQYAMAKSQVSSLPVVGRMASEQLGRLEGQAGGLIEKAAERGLSQKNVELAAGLGRRFVQATGGMY